MSVLSNMYNAQRGQKRALGLLRLELQIVMSSHKGVNHDLNQGSSEEQRVLVTTEPSLLMWY